MLSGLWRIAPTGLRGYIFLTSKATGTKAPQESPFSCQRGKANQPGVRGRGGGAGRPPAFDQFASYSFAEVFFFHANGKSSNKCAEIHLFGICPNRWCFLTWERSQPRTCLKSAPPRPPTTLPPTSQSLRVVNSTLNVQVWTVPFLSRSFRPVRGFARSPESILTPN